MGVRKTNILVEVSDPIYDMVVLPHKQAKTFSKLIASLIQGYVENEYIRAYTEGKLDELHKASVDALDDVLDEMKQSLSSMGLFTDELKNVTNQGKDYFEERLESEQSSVPQCTNQESSEEVEELRSSVKELKEQNSQILDLLKSLMSSGSVTVSTTSEKSTEKSTLDITKNSSEKKILGSISKPVHQNSPTTDLEPLDEYEDGIIEIDDEEEEKESLDASSVLSALMSGNSFGF